MAYETPAGPAAELPPGTVKGAGRYAIGNHDGDRFAVTRRCRHLMADLAEGEIDGDGCLVCPWHGARYDVSSGEMVEGPGGVYGKIPGLGGFLRFTTKVVPLGVGEVVERDGELYVRRAGTED